jgi:hypothetical protein
MSRLALAHGLRAAASMLQRLADRMTPAASALLSSWALDSSEAICF